MNNEKKINEEADVTIKFKENIRTPNLAILIGATWKHYIKTNSFTIKELNNISTFKLERGIWMLRVIEGNAIVNQNNVPINGVILLNHNSDVVIGNLKFRFSLKVGQKSYKLMIAEAIQSSPEQKLSLNEIYTYFESNYGFSKKDSNTWKNSIRHNLSINDMFSRVPKVTNSPSKGMLWAVRDDSCSIDANFENCRYIDRSSISLTPIRSSNYRHEKLGYEPQHGGLHINEQNIQPKCSLDRNLQKQINFCIFKENSSNFTESADKPQTIQSGSYSIDENMKIQAKIMEKPGICDYTSKGSPSNSDLQKNIDLIKTYQQTDGPTRARNSDYCFERENIGPQPCRNSTLNSSAYMKDDYVLSYEKILTLQMPFRQKRKINYEDITNKKYKQTYRPRVVSYLSVPVSNTTRINNEDHDISYEIPEYSSEYNSDLFSESENKRYGGKCMDPDGQSSYKSRRRK